MFLLTGNMLKLIAALSMLLDHMGILLFPQQVWLRIAGRLAFPIFAYMIAEGCRYTRSRARYLGLMAVLAAIYQAVYYLFNGDLYFSILVTFSLSILTIYALDACKAKANPISICALLFALLIVWWLNDKFTIDYGFWGCMAPVFASLPANTRYDRPGIRLGCFALGLVLLSVDSFAIQYYCLLSLPLLMLYNGKRGKCNLKYFFYIFYPAHLVVLQGLQMLFF